MSGLTAERLRTRRMFFGGESGEERFGDQAAGDTFTTVEVSIPGDVGWHLFALTLDLKQTFLEAIAP